MFDSASAVERLRLRFAAHGISPSGNEADLLRAINALMPTGPMRVALNMINPLLVRRDAAGAVTGIVPEIANAIDGLLGCDIAFVPLPTPAAVMETMGNWDVAFMAMDRERAAALTFSEPYLRLGATFLSRSDDGIDTPRDLDRPGYRIACPKGAAFAEWVRDNMSHATILWDFKGDIGSAIDRGEISAAAGLRASLHARATGSTLRLLDSDFTAVEQAIAVPKNNEAGIPLVDFCLRHLRDRGDMRRIVDRFAAPGISCV